MFTHAQLSRLSPVVQEAWERHCDQNDFDPHRKASNGYRAWYEGILEDATGKTSTKVLAGAKDFGKVLLAFAQAAGDERLIRDLAEDEEHRHRWVLRMLCCDLSYLRGDVVGWEYVRSIYGQSKLPPGDFEDCPADLLIRVIAMLDTQIRRECRRRDLAPIQIPRRAKAAATNAAHAGKRAEILDAMRDGLDKIAREQGLHPDGLLSWYEALLKYAAIELAQRRSAAAGIPASTSTTSDSALNDCPF